MFLDCYEVDANNPAVHFTLAFGPADGIDIATICPNTCLQNGVPLSGIAEGIFCFCSANGEYLWQWYLRFSIHARWVLQPCYTKLSSHYHPYLLHFIHAIVNDLLSSVFFTNTLNYLLFICFFFLLLF